MADPPPEAVDTKMGDAVLSSADDATAHRKSVAPESVPELDSMQLDTRQDSAGSHTSDFHQGSTTMLVESEQEDSRTAAVGRKRNIEEVNTNDYSSSSNTHDDTHEDGSQKRRKPDNDSYLGGIEGVNYVSELPPIEISSAGEAEMSEPSSSKPTSIFSLLKGDFDQPGAQMGRTDFTSNTASSNLQSAKPAWNAGVKSGLRTSFGSKAKAKLKTARSYYGDDNAEPVGVVTTEYMTGVPPKQTSEKDNPKSFDAMMVGNSIADSPHQISEDGDPSSVDAKMVEDSPAESLQNLSDDRGSSHSGEPRSNRAKETRAYLDSLYSHLPPRKDSSAQPPQIEASSLASTPLSVLNIPDPTYQSINKKHQRDWPDAEKQIYASASNDPNTRQEYLRSLHLRGVKTVQLAMLSRQTPNFTPRQRQYYVVAFNGTDQHIQDYLNAVYGNPASKLEYLTSVHRESLQPALHFHPIDEDMMKGWSKEGRLMHKKAKNGTLKNVKSYLNWLNSKPEPAFDKLLYFRAVQQLNTKDSILLESSTGDVNAKDSVPSESTSKEVNAKNPVLSEPTAKDSTLLESTTKEGPSASPTSELMAIDISAADLLLQRRYFPSAGAFVFCLACAGRGHLSQNCPLMTCTHCGSKHSSLMCSSNVICGKCRVRGQHSTNECPEKLLPARSESNCNICQSRDHLEDSCHHVWRSFRPHTQEILKVREIQVHCYKCAGTHFGPECGLHRGRILSGGVTWSTHNLLQYIDPTAEATALSAGDYLLPPPTQEILSIKGNAENPIDLEDSDDEDNTFIRPKIQSGNVPRNAGSSGSYKRPQGPRYPPRQHQHFNGPNSLNLQNGFDQGQLSQPGSFSFSMQNNQNDQNSKGNHNNYNNQVNRQGQGKQKNQGNSNSQNSQKKAKPSGGSQPPRRGKVKKPPGGGHRGGGKQ